MKGLLKKIKKGYWRT